MAAYWLEMFFKVPESNDQNVGYSARVSTKPKSRSVAVVGGPKRAWGSSSSRGGISENEAKPISASSVLAARVLRHNGYRGLSRR